MITSRRKTLLEDEVMKDSMGDVGDFVDDADTPIFWHIPNSGGSSMKSYYNCMGLVEASEIGLEMGLARSGLTDIAFTEYPTIATQMFDAEHQARFFTLIRHPIERTASLFHHQISEMMKEEGIHKPDLAHLTLEDFARQRIDSKDNGGFMVSSLTDKRHSDPLTNDDLERAKDILRHKFIIGLMPKMEESINRFDNYFGWHTIRDHERCFDVCIRQGKRSDSYENVEESSEVWKMLEKFHYFDMQLYEYALELYDYQANLVLVQSQDELVVGGGNAPVESN